MARRPITRSSAKNQKNGKAKKKITARMLTPPRQIKKTKVAARKTRSKVKKTPTRKQTSSKSEKFVDKVITNVFGLIGKSTREEIEEDKERRRLEKERKKRLKRFMAGELSDDDHDGPSTSKSTRNSSRKPYPWEKVKETARKTANLHKRVQLSDESDDEPTKVKPKEPLDHVPLKYSVPYEKLVDILQFLDRMESEKCLFVSKRWHSIVSNSEKILPKREKIQIYNINNAFWLKRKFAKDQERVTASKADLLRNCLCTKFEISRFNEEVMEELEAMSKISGRPIAAEEVHFTVDEDYEEMGILKFLPKILKSIIRARKVVLVLKAKILNAIFRDPGILKIPEPPIEIDLKAAPNYYVYGGKYSDSAGICASQKVLNFIQHGDLSKPRRFNLHFESQLDGFWDKYIEYFMKKTTKCDRFPKNIIIDPAPNTMLFDGMKNSLDKSPAAKTTTGSEHSLRYHYKLKRPGGALLEISLGKHQPTYYTVYDKDEIQKV